MQALVALMVVLVVWFGSTIKATKRVTEVRSDEAKIVTEPIRDCCEINKELVGCREEVATTSATKNLPTEEMTE